MTLWSAEDAAAATGGKVQGDWQASGVSIDTRTLALGDLFVALKDARDGHDFVAQALEKGAAAALVSHVPESVADDAPLLIVEDVLKALEALGSAARSRTSAKVIAVTGSVGKTSTKEMLRTALQGQGHIHAAEKSFNNHWGVPLTLARMPKDTDFAIIEIGMNHPGEIEPLAAFAKPDVAIVTTVAPAHLEAFEDIAAIAHEKASIFSGLSEVGIGIFNSDVETSDILRAAAPNGVSFGESDADWTLEETVQTVDNMACRAKSPSGPILYKVSTQGRHFALNALACLAAIEAVGGDIAMAAMALSAWSPPDGRGKRRVIALDAVHARARIDLFDDAYNANPASIAAALEVLAMSQPPDPRGGRIAVLGDMKELGPQAKALHAAIADHPAMEEIAKIHCVGPLMKSLHDALPTEKRGLWAENAAALATRPSQLVHAGDSILVKGSLSMNMAQIVDAVSNLGEAVADTELEIESEGTR